VGNIVDHLVEVEWIDTHTVAAGWTDPAHIERLPFTCRTLGYLIASAVPGHITVAQSFAADGSVAHADAIPLGCVRRVLSLSRNQVLPVEPPDN
jgi:hypothetical protein